MKKKPVFKNTSLSEEFAVASFIVLLLAFLITEWWVSKTIERRVIQQTVLTTIKFHNSFISRMIGELSETDRLDQDSITLLKSFDHNSPVGRKIASLKLWEKSGRLVYSSDLSQIGKVSPARTEITNAWGNTESWEMVEPGDLQISIINRNKGDLLKIISPIYQARSDHILAVAEIYLYTDTLQNQIFRSQVQSWGMGIAVTLIVYILLYLLVRRGSRTITTQQQTLKLQLKQLSDLLSVNNKLHNSVKLASNRTIEINESFLRRISAELHDGPAQALGYALLRLDSVFNECNKQMENTSANSTMLKEREVLRTALTDALEDIRNLASGMAMPELNELNLNLLIKRVANIHEQRSNTKVDLDIQVSKEGVPLPLKIGIYRIVQEGLTNAFRHGKGINQRVQLRQNDKGLVVQVSDEGSGFDVSTLNSQDQKLGIIGMKERVLSLGGHFKIQSSPGSGTKIIASFKNLPEDKHE